MTNKIKMFAFSIASFLLSGPAYAIQPDTIWAWWLPKAASPVKQQIHEFHYLLMIIMTAIVVFVTVLLIYTVWRYRRKANPIPSKTTHNVPIEIVWTIIPCLILIVIAVPSFKLMYYMDRTEKPDLTLKVTGYQWYWGYSYPDQEIEEYSLYMIPDAADDKKNEFAELRAMPTYQRLLSTYELSSGKVGFIVLPVKKNIRILVTGGDVIHSFALPAFGVKKDAVPGRMNETWTRIKKPGIYYGQCSEICGIKHGYMPIEIRAVPQKQFNAWAKMMKEDTAAAFQMIQEATVQYASKQVIAPKLKPEDLVEIVKEKL
jgi:cytochrome c oxidase subunit 2